jgi:DNA primase
MIPKETIQNIIETARVEEVISDFITLQKRGVNYIARCPFHDEKTPSFVVSPVKGIYKCFGCGKAGNSINFVMEHEQYSYPEALKYIAKKYNIEIEEEEQTPEQLEEDNRREIIYAIHKFAGDYFSKILFESEEGKSIGLSYFKERDFTEKTIRDFNLGYAFEKSDSFYQNAVAQGYKKEYLVESGIVIEKNGRYFDRFAGRVLFPIHSLSGRIIGFGGRTLRSDKKIAKYLNSPETIIYSKSNVLYGMYFAKSEIIKRDNCYLVEGYTDVISMHQAGVKNVVASSGTSLTTNQIRLIQRYTKNITILYDGDTAGIKASFRGIDMILEQGLNVKILLFPEGQDPDSYVRSHRSSEVFDLLQNKTEDFIQFKTRILLEESKKDPIKKAALIKDIVQSISVIPDSIVREVYIKECASLMEMTEQTLIRELNVLLRKKYKKKFHQETIQPAQDEVDMHRQDMEVPLSTTEEQERDILRLLFNYPDNELVFHSKNEAGEVMEARIMLQDFMLENLAKYGFTFENPVFQKILTAVIDRYKAGERLNTQEFINYSEADVSETVIDLIMTKYELSKNWKDLGRIIVVGEDKKLERASEQAILSLGEKILKEQIKKKKEALKEIKSDEVDAYLIELMEDEKRWRNIYVQLGRVLSPG